MHFVIINFYEKKEIKEIFKKKRKEKKCCTTHDDLSFLTGLVRLSFWHDWPHIYCTAIEIHVRSPLTVDLVVCLVSDTHAIFTLI